MNLSYDWDGELERQLHESPRETAHRHWQREQQNRKEHGIKDWKISYDNSIAKKELDKEYGED